MHSYLSTSHGKCAIISRPKLFVKPLPNGTFEVKALTQAGGTIPVKEVRVYKSYPHDTDTLVIKTGTGHLLAVPQDVLKRTSFTSDINQAFFGVKHLVLVAEMPTPIDIPVYDFSK